MKLYRFQVNEGIVLISFLLLLLMTPVLLSINSKSVPMMIYSVMYLILVMGVIRELQVLWLVLRAKVKVDDAELLPPQTTKLVTFRILNIVWFILFTFITSSSQFFGILDIAGISYWFKQNDPFGVIAFVVFFVGLIPYGIVLYRYPKSSKLVQKGGKGLGGTFFTSKDVAIELEKLGQ
ncbi:MAG: hypothetical protein D6732_09115 [Methanobacteriota archaeon]|nr:MAG: hypothetical protein D6732_09115 [Euryarchaeota archaeon]